MLYANFHGDHGLHYDFDSKFIQFFSCGSNEPVQRRIYEILGGIEFKKNHYWPILISERIEISRNVENKMAVYIRQEFDYISKSVCQ